MNIHIGDWKMVKSAKQYWKKTMQINTIHRSWMRRNHQKQDLFHLFMHHFLKGTFLKDRVGFCLL